MFMTYQLSYGYLQKYHLIKCDPRAIATKYPRFLYYLKTLTKYLGTNFSRSDKKKSET